MGDIRVRHGEDDERDDAPRAVEGAGVEHAAFPVGALAGAAIGGVGGALVGEETPAGDDHAAAGDREGDTGRER